jgi:hypothetical protein
VLSLFINPLHTNTNVGGASQSSDGASYSVFGSSLPAPSAALTNSRPQTIYATTVPGAARTQTLTAGLDDYEDPVPDYAEPGPANSNPIDTRFGRHTVTLDNELYVSDT